MSDQKSIHIIVEDDANRIMVNGIAASEALAEMAASLIGFAMSVATEGNKEAVVQAIVEKVIEEAKEALSEDDC